ncbi:hypothetical protein [Oceanibaculum indicum]|uniref:Uncharacterized protein n=1 Tax=Oceanibaculum indicum TaxID=526216 RepID=A0A420WGN8_9PROT|nr:hypothetical protein [Oceanibaculum indicum]RKQ70105.1 hypothetical protein BCL74_2044 [Oceanibaculum indicum]
MGDRGRKVVDTLDQPLGRVILRAIMVMAIGMVGWMGNHIGTSVLGELRETSARLGQVSERLVRIETKVGDLERGQERRMDRMDERLLHLERRSEPASRHARDAKPASETVAPY